MSPLTAGLFFTSFLTYGPDLWDEPLWILDFSDDMPIFIVENDPIEIVDFPMKHGWIFPSFFVCLPEYNPNIHMIIPWLFQLIHMVHNPMIVP